MFIHKSVLANHFDFEKYEFRKLVKLEFLRCCRRWRAKKKFKKNLVQHLKAFQIFWMTYANLEPGNLRIHYAFPIKVCAEIFWFLLTVICHTIYKWKFIIFSKAHSLKMNYTHAYAKNWFIFKAYGSIYSKNGLIELNVHYQWTNMWNKNILIIW